MAPNASPTHGIQRLRFAVVETRAYADTPIVAQATKPNVLPRNMEVTPIQRAKR